MTEDICPVCERGEWTTPNDPVWTHIVSHLDCVQKLAILKCCGNCKHIYLSGYEFDRTCDVDHEYVECTDPCRFSPPQWDIHPECGKVRHEE